MISFSILNKDQKTYNYFLRIFEFVMNDNNESLLKLENLFQVEEIENHLKINNITEIKEKNIESIKWIKKNGEPFRIYLNSIKLIVFLFINKRKNCKQGCKYAELTFENYCNVIEVINLYRELLEDIF